MKTQALSGELFAGTGMLGRAVGEVFGTRPAWFCEFDAAPSKVLAHHYPDVPNYGDVTKIDFTAVPHTHVRAGGFPCQDVSVSGARAGLRDGTRSGLWSEFARSIAEDRPDWVVIENVAGLLSAPAGRGTHVECGVCGWPDRRGGVDRDVQPAEEERGNPVLPGPHDARHDGASVDQREGACPDCGGQLVERAHSDVEPCPWCLGDEPSEPALRALGAVLADLAALGFDAEWTSIRASDIGAPHGRLRVFILAWPAERTIAVDAIGVAGGRGADTRAAGGRTRRAAADADRDGLERVGRVDTVGRDGDGRGGAHEARDGAEPSAHSLTLLPTPTVVMNDGESVESWSARRERVKATGVNGNGMGMPLPIAVQLLPTPTAAIQTKSTRAMTASRENGRRSGGGQSSPLGLEETASLIAGVRPEHVPADEDLPPASRAVVHALLPTPGAYDGERGGSQHPDKRRDGGHSVTLQDVTEHALLGTPRTAQGMMNALRDPEAIGNPRGRFEDQIALLTGTDWGPYAAAIARWESVMGRPAPSPVRMDGKGGKARLNPELTEWMMGWPHGWVTGAVIGLSRAEQLKACGNGVVLQQAVAALRILLARPGVPAVEWQVAA